MTNGSLMKVESIAFLFDLILYVPKEIISVK